MKKLIVAASLFLGIIMAGNAQEIGLRFGDVTGGNVAIDGIFSTGEFNRIHADVSFGSGGVGIDALWDFLYRPLGDEAFNWYVGVGVNTFLGNDFTLGVPGEIGIEYHFNGVPLALGLDYRPWVEIIDNTSFHGGGFGFNVRWVFGQ